MSTTNPSKASELIPDKNGFVKGDSGKKYRPELVAIEFRTGMAEILAEGAVEYGDDNWKNCTDPSRYIGALMRHMESFERGEKVDPKSGHHTLLHAACCIMMLHGIDLIMNGDSSAPSELEETLSDHMSQFQNSQKVDMSKVFEGSSTPNPGGLY